MPQRLPRRLSTRGASSTSSASRDGSYHRVLSRIPKADVLVLDDFALAPYRGGAPESLQILEDRYGLRATVFTSQIGPDRGTHLADPTVADAICDRVLHGAHKIASPGPAAQDQEESKSET
ncbi:MAG: ATP-binding protein [Myxococcales bacterium]|nr:ATP-binding protein [Myxococcales bacterium]